MTATPMPDTTLTSAELDELEALAKAATPGKWQVEEGIKSGIVAIFSSTPKGQQRIGLDYYDNDAAYIASANPATILAILSLARAGLEAGKAEEWLPIETAPRDGTVILGGHEQFVFTVWWDDEAGGWVDGNTSGYSEDLTTYEVTHWRHLPAPPAIRALPLTTEGGKP